MFIIQLLNRLLTRQLIVPPALKKTYCASGAKQKKKTRKVQKLPEVHCTDIVLIISGAKKKSKVQKLPEVHCITAHVCTHCKVVPKVPGYSVPIQLHCAVCKVPLDGQRPCALDIKR